MKQIEPIPFPSIDTLMNFEGNVKILDFENEGYKFQESFYKNISKYFQVQNESLKELNRNLEEMSLEDMDKLWDEAKKLEKR